MARTSMLALVTASGGEIMDWVVIEVPFGR
jgi:hypothetical protein